MAVDDNPANLKLLEDMLTQRGLRVRSFPRGRLAIAAAERMRPDLILLDINMPEMNGYEVCERLKSNPELADVPIIFLSALAEIDDKVKAFRSGAVDYVSKPFQFEEVHARVETHLRIHDLRQELKTHNQRLEEAVAARSRELADANRRLTILDRSKSDFLNLISHEFRTPLHGLLGVGELILDGMPSSEDRHKLEDLFRRSRRRILAILDDALLLTEIDVAGEQFRPAPVRLNTLLDRALKDAADLASARGVKLPAPAACADLVIGDEELLEKALRALLETAVKFSNEGEAVALGIARLPDSVELVIEGHGKTIPDPALERFFDVLAVSEGSTPGGDLGLGPAMAHRILSLYGSTVTVRNRDSSGIELAISLRAASLALPARI